MNNEELDALIIRLKELEDPQKEAFPSFADTDWRTLSGVVAREIEFLRQQLASRDDEVSQLRKQLAARDDLLRLLSDAYANLDLLGRTSKRPTWKIFGRKLEKQYPNNED